MSVSRQFWRMNIQLVLLTFAVWAIGDEHREFAGFCGLRHVDIAPDHSLTTFQWYTDILLENVVEGLSVLG